MLYHFAIISFVIFRLRRATLKQSTQQTKNPHTPSLNDDKAAGLFPCGA